MREPTSSARRDRLARRASASSSPLDPDWLVQRHLSRDVRDALARHARGRLLDVGCGGRPYQSAVPPGVRYVGADAPGSSRPDVWARASALPFAPGAFETVLCTQVLEHLEEPAEALSEIARVLAPGGRLVLSGPQAWFLHEEPNDYYRYTRFGLERVCRRAGLEVIEHRDEGGFWAMAGIFLAVHLGSYARWAAERRRGTPALAAGGPPRWRTLLWPLRVPLAVANLVFAALDALPQPGIFAVNHLVVAGKPTGGAAR